MKTLIPAVLLSPISWGSASAAEPAICDYQEVRRISFYEMQNLGFALNSPLNILPAESYIDSYGDPILNFRDKNTSCHVYARPERYKSVVLRPQKVRLEKIVNCPT